MEKNYQYAVFAGNDFIGATETLLGAKRLARKNQDNLGRVPFIYKKEDKRMAKGTASCTCETCGKEFEVEKICYNRRDADQWAEWAAEHYCECTSCYRKRMEEEAKKEAEAMNLPEIVAVSEKQKKYAEDLRAKYIQRNKTFIKHTQEMLDSLDVDGAKAEADKEGKTLDQWLVDAFRAMCLDNYYKILTCTSAKEIIDLARR